MLSDLTLGARPKGRTALAARWIVAHRDGGHRLLENGEIVIEEDRILHVGPRFEGEVARRVDLGEVLISPGLSDLDALSDLDTTTLGVDCGPAWAKGRVWPESYLRRGPYEMYTPEELAFQKRFSFAQLLCNGITSALPIASLFYREWGESVAEFEAAAEAAGRWRRLNRLNQLNQFEEERVEIPATPTAGRRRRLNRLNRLEKILEILATPEIPLTPAPVRWA